MLVRWLSSLCAFGNRDARHLQYSNVIKKNSVPLKEVLTQQSAVTSRTSFDDAAMRDVDDAREACVVCAGVCRNRRKRFHCSVFLIHVQRILRAIKACEGRASWLTAPCVDSESWVLASKKFFVCTGAFVRSRESNAALVANHRSSIRNTPIASLTLRAFSSAIESR
jgi:hypothetical protein